MSPELKRALDRAVIGLFQNPNKDIPAPCVFLATIFMGLTVSENLAIPTARVSSKLTFEINTPWFLSLSEKMRITLIAHELWHLAYKHVDPKRMGKRDPKIWNMACDHAINLMLEEHGYHFDTDPQTGQKIGLLDPQYRGMSAEQIYAELEKGAIKIVLPFGEDFECEPDPTLSPEAVAAQEAELQSLLIRGTLMNQMASGKGAGPLPGDLQEQIDALLNPKLPWDTLLQRWLTEAGWHGYTWRRPNRRFADDYLPSRGKQEGLAHLRWYIDSSGSMSRDQLQVLNSEAKGAKDLFNPELMTISCFDVGIRETWEFSAEHDFHGLNFAGRGGTAFEPVLEDIRQHRPTAAIILSDMDCRHPTKEEDPGIPILWIALDAPDVTEMAFGTVINMDSDPNNAP